MYTQTRVKKMLRRTSSPKMKLGAAISGDYSSLVVTIKECGPTKICLQKILYHKLHLIRVGKLYRGGLNA